MDATRPGRRTTVACNDADGRRGFGAAARRDRGAGTPFAFRTAECCRIVAPQSEESAVKIGRYELMPTLKAIWKDVQGDDITGLAAEVAYNVLFSVVPLLIFLTAMVGVVSRAIGVESVMDRVTDWLFNSSGMPAATAQALERPIRQVVANEAGGVLTFGAVFALWGAKNAVSALMKALNVAFDVPEGRSFVVKTLTAIGLTIALGVGLIGASLILLLGSEGGGAAAGLFGLGEVWQAIWSILRWVLVPVLLVLALAVLYWAGPNVKAPFTWLTPGAVFAVLGWALATLLLGFYFQYAAAYVSTYGVLGGVLAFVFWLYVMAAILLLGGSINSVLLKMVGETAVPRVPPKPDAPASADAVHAEATGSHTPSIGLASLPGATTTTAATTPPGVTAMMTPAPSVSATGTPRFVRGLRAIGLGALAGMTGAAIERVRK
jgi:membrane protein